MTNVMRNEALCEMVCRASTAVDAQVLQVRFGNVWNVGLVCFVASRFARRGHGEHEYCYFMNWRHAAGAAGGRWNGGSIVLDMGKVKMLMRRMICVRARRYE